MFRREETKLSKFRYSLEPLLTKRYGSATDCTKSQIDRTIEEENLDAKFIEYVYLVFCSSETLESLGINSSDLEKLKMLLEKVSSSGDGVSTPVESFFGFDGAEGGVGESGGGGD